MAVITAYSQFRPSIEADATRLYGLVDTGCRCTVQRLTTHGRVTVETFPISTNDDNNPDGLSQDGFRDDATATQFRSEVAFSSAATTTERNFVVGRTTTDVRRSESSQCPGRSTMPLSRTTRLPARIHHQASIAEEPLTVYECV